MIQQVQFVLLSIIILNTLLEVKEVGLLVKGNHIRSRNVDLPEHLPDSEDCIPVGKKCGSTEDCCEDHRCYRLERRRKPRCHKCRVNNEHCRRGEQCCSN